MSKKCPREKRGRSGALTPAESKREPAYWRERLFKSRYAYKGELREVRNWSVKIQYLGKRKTFALRASRRDEAAAEACELYRALVAHGWKTAAIHGFWRRPHPSPPTRETARGGADKLDASYWTQRLIYREYTMNLQPATHQELSVRLDYGGAGHYFALGTNSHRVAAARASRIYQTLVSQGWEAVDRRFARELTVAFHWLDIPLAWTYTTIHTLNTGAGDSPIEPLKQTGTAFKVAVAESDAGIRRALEWCLNRTDGLCCVATCASAEEALRDVRRTPVQLVLVSHNLSDGAGAACLEELKSAVPEVAGLLYSVYESSEELFKRTPGGAGTYLLRRTGPTHFLEPIRSWLKSGQTPGESLASTAWQYFKDSVASMPVGGFARHLASLTQREQEVLGLLSQGRPDKEIADHLGISIYTVHEHVRNILDKLGVHNRTEAAVKFLQK